MSFSRTILVACALAAIAVPASAKQSGVDSAGTAVAVALPLIAGGISAYKDDWDGVAELLFDTGATAGTAFGLKYVVHEERPDHSDFKSFPSDQAALAFAPAAYLWDRYGWEYGLPAYAAAAFTGYTRVDAKEHHWWDVAASAGIAWGYSQIFTTRYHKSYNVYTGLYATPHGAFVAVHYTF